MPPPDALASPVPAQSVPSEPRASEPIACGKSFGQAVVYVAPASVLFHTPPPADATKIVFGCVGSTTTSVTRPPMLLAPTYSHEPPPDWIASACSAACASAARLTVGAPPSVLSC